MPIQISDATLLVNNEAVSYLPNTLKYTEGKGEQKVRALSAGGGKTEQVVSNDLESNFSTVKFGLAVTVETIAQVREWKERLNANTIQITAQNVEGRLSKTIASAIITNDPEIGLGAETSIDVEFRGASAT